MKTIDKTNMTQEQLDQLSRHTGNLIQTIDLKLTLSFNNLGWSDQATLPMERIIEGVREHLAVLWHVPATGAELHIFDKERHTPTCKTQTDSLGQFNLCDCGAYGEVGPPRDFWSLMSKFIKVEAVGTKIELIEDVCPTCGNLKRVFGCYDACGSPDVVLKGGK